MNKSKKIISSLLALCITLSAGSAMTFADENSTASEASSDYTQQDDIMVGEVESFFLNSEDDHIGEVIEDLYAAKVKLNDAAENLKRVVDVKGLGVTKDNVTDLYLGFVDEHPEYFYILASCRYTYQPSTNEILNIYPKYITATAANYGEEAPEEIERQNEIINSMIADFKTNTDMLMSCITPEMTDVDKLLALHDALACHTTYATQSSGEFESSIYTAYGAIVERGGVCQSYSLAYKYLATLAGIEDIYIVKNSVHGWNMVKLDGQWYHIDVTYDDPTKDVLGRVNHKYFLISDDKLKENDTSANHATWQPSYSATDKQYEDASIAWLNTTSQIIFDDGNVYYNDMRSSSSSKTIGVITKVTPQGEKQELAAIEELWYAVSGGYYTGNFTRLFKEGDYIYYNTPDSVIKLNVNDGTSEKVYTLSDELKNSGSNIYGLSKGENSIIVSFSTSPTGTQTIQEVEYDFSGSSENPDPVFSIGDVDKNGVVDINDVTYIQKYLAAYETEIDPATADVDENGVITIDDATIIQSIIAGNIKV